MSGNSIMAVSQGPVSQAAGADNKLRWAALDSRNERLAMASEFADVAREEPGTELRAAS
jgi:hypothetical protein